MAITYKLHLWGGKDAYLNLPDGINSRIRIKKMSGREEVANLDYDMPLTDLMSLDDAGLQEIVNRLTNADEDNDAKTLAAMAIVPAAKNAALNDRIKAISLKARVGEQVPISNL